MYIVNEREESVVKQHNLFRKMLYSNNETNYMFRPVMAIVRFLQRLRRVYISV